jgi:hypothetical protein
LRLDKNGTNFSSEWNDCEYCKALRLQSLSKDMQYQGREAYGTFGIADRPTDAREE